MISIPLFHPNLFVAFELLGFISFAIIFFREVLRRNSMRIFEILSCAVFGMILEIGNTYIAHTYYYSDLFLAKVMNVPLAIGLWWVVIIYCSMLLSDQYNIPWRFRPAMDALIAVIIDISIDVVAIRLGFWHWSIPLSQEWYGVPFENLVGWILVVLSFSYLIRFIRTLNHKRIFTKLIMILSPLLSYISLLSGLIIFSLITIFPYQVNNWTTFLKFNYKPDFNILYQPEVQLWKEIIFVIFLIELINVVIWVAVKYRKNYLKCFDAVSFSILSLAHLFFIFALFYSGIYKEYPIFILIGLSSFLVHCFIHFAPYLSSFKSRSLKKAKEVIKEREKNVEKIINKSLR
ncbi:MAG: carotenoid biosynthesis protein [Candidatus Paceibacterota bacterium]|jgi:uncharacterized membrane protein